MIKITKELLKKVGSLKQIAGLKRVLLDDGSERGVRAVEVNTGSGLHFTILLDRGMDIGEASYRGKSLAWISPNGFRNPQYFVHNNLEWLRNWGGGLLTGSGLRNIGGYNEYKGEHLALHGRLSNLPAEHVNCTEELVNGNLVLTVSGTMRESRVFGENLVLTRTIRCEAGKSMIELRDRIENQSFRSTHAGILYHINLGWPLIDADTKIVSKKHKVTPRDEMAANGLGSWQECFNPIENFIEQCYYHDLPAKADGMASIAVENARLNMMFRISFRKRELPLLTQWKQFGEGEYVLGLEPGTSHVEGTLAEEEKFASLRVLNPGESFETLLMLEAESPGAGEASQETPL